MGNDEATKSDQPIFNHCQPSITFCFLFLPVSWHVLSSIMSHLHHFLIPITSYFSPLPVSHHFLSPVTSCLPLLLVFHHFLPPITSYPPSFLIFQDFLAVVLGPIT